MAHIRVLRIQKTGKVEALTVLPGTFNTDQEAMASIKEDGDYFFQEVHSVTVKKGKKDGNETDEEA